MKSPTTTDSSAGSRAFAFPDLLMVLAVLLVLVAILIPVMGRSRSKTHLTQCTANLQQINRAILSYSKDNNDRLPQDEPGQKGAVWWFYKESVKGELGLKGPSSPTDKVFGCPDDRGYEENKPFRQSAKFDYSSYVFNGVNLPGLPNVAGRALSSIKDPARTLLVMEWTAHAPLSWHASRTGQKNQPFYNDAQSVVGFADGHVDFIKIYFDGMNAAYTRDPVSGYGYNYSGN